MLRDILRGEDAQIAGLTEVLTELRPDVLVLTDMDHDAGGVTLTALADHLTGAGLPYTHQYARRPNAGLATGLDMDGDGRTGTPRDAQGYGRFMGDGGLAILSALPIDAAGAADFSALLWRDLPGATLPEMTLAPEVWDSQRLSSTAHWTVPIRAGDIALTLAVWSATPPVFDGPEDRNGLRARDELRLWTRWMDGALSSAPTGPFVILGNANLDPADGEGDSAAMAAFLTDTRIIDPRPASAGGAAAANPDHQGDPALDTADWRDDGPGNLRVVYALPSADLRVLDAGVHWPADVQSGPDMGPHHLVWVDIALP